MSNHRKPAPEHPGRTLRDLMQNCELSQNGLARYMGVSPRRINEIILGKRSITAETAIGLAAVLGGFDHRPWKALKAGITRRVMVV